MLMIFPDHAAKHTAMTQPPSSTSLSPGPLVLIVMIVAAALTRLPQFLPNFSPIEAVALFGGAYFANRWLAMVVPLVTIFLSDVALALLHGGVFRIYFTTYLPQLLAVYTCVVVSTALGFGLRGRVEGARLMGYALTGSVLFFVATNFVVWLTAASIPQYTACNVGLVPCYVAAIPFFKWTLLSTLFYSALLFGGFALLRLRVPALRAQTV